VCEMILAGYRMTGEHCPVCAMALLRLPDESDAATPPPSRRRVGGECAYCPMMIGEVRRRGGESGNNGRSSSSAASVGGRRGGGGGGRSRGRMPPRRRAAPDIGRRGVRRDRAGAGAGRRCAGGGGGSVALRRVRRSGAGATGRIDGVRGLPRHPGGGIGRRGGSSSSRIDDGRGGGRLSRDSRPVGGERGGSTRLSVEYRDESLAPSVVGVRVDSESSPVHLVDHLRSDWEPFHRVERGSIGRRLCQVARLDTGTTRRGNGVANINNDPPGGESGNPSGVVVGS
jgi:hypothetical protein